MTWKHSPCIYPQTNFICWKTSTWRASGKWGSFVCSFRMIRAPVQSRWLQRSSALWSVSGEHRALIACPVLSVVHSGHSTICPPWIAHKSPPTCSGSGCQGQMEPAKRSHPAVGLFTHRAVPFHNQLFHRYSLSNNNYQALHVSRLASDARFPASAGTIRRKVRVKKTRVGQLLEANPVVRLGQRQLARPRVKQGPALSDRRFQEEFELDHENIDIHSIEGALHDSLPNDEEMNEALSYANRQMNFRKTKIKTAEQSGDLNEFDKQYFPDAANMKHRSFTPQSQDAKQNAEVDLNEGNEFDQQYFGNLNVHKSRPGVADIGEKDAMPVQNQSKPKKPVYMDTSAPENLEEVIDYGLRTKEALKDFDKQLGQLFEDAGQDKSINIQSLFQFEPHEKATEFQRFEDERDHKELTFDTEKQDGEKHLEKILSRPLRAKLEAERIIQERKEELRIGNHHLSDLEPEIIKAMKAVQQAKTQRQSKVKSKTQEGRQVYGTPDPSLPASDTSCSGCGAQLQGNNPRLPGFLPSEKYQELLADGSLSEAICQRCWYLTHKQMALDVSIGENDYEDIIAKIRKKRALVVVLVDLLDFPCSLIPDLKVMVGEKKPMIIVGNKADLLPKDSSDCHDRIKKQLLEACIDAGVCNEDSVKHVCIISAKSGFGIEGLITALQKKWGTTDDVYLLGTANVGKSSLFNRLLQSDYAKAKAAWLIGKATISRWPGTTLNLLRFPIVKPTAEKLSLRSERLSEEARQVKAEEESRKLQVREDVKLDHEAYVRGSVGRSYEIVTNADEDEEKALDDSRDPFVMAVDKMKQSSTEPHLKPRRSGKEDVPFRFRQEEFALGKWFYDTPGLIHDQQILTKLTADELKLVIPKRGILPKTIILKPGNTVFLAGMGRIDYLEGHKAAFFTFFSSKVLPLRVTTTSEADDYYQTMANTNRLKVPLGGPERMQTLPPLKPVDMTVTGVGWRCSAADVLFSSTGWAAVTAADGMEVNLKAYTPGGHGCLLRRPALLPYVVNLRGDRMPKKSPFFKLDKQKLMRYL